MSEYIDSLQKLKVDPNFWISEEYFQKAGLIEKKDGGSIWIEDEGTMVFPPLVWDSSLIFPEKIWSDFSDFNPAYFQHYREEFLDYEYLYDPKDFLEMRGKKWMVFRKNSKKFPRRYGKDIFYESISEYIVKKGEEETQKDLIQLLSGWLKERNEEIQDSDVMVEYVLNGERRWVLSDAEGKLLGLNCWDENYKHLNYRYCIHESFPFLSEYMRYMFYISPSVQSSGKLVNDGGVLDNPRLELFKDKLNPVRKRKVNSWISIKGGHYES